MVRWYKFWSDKASINNNLDDKMSSTPSSEEEESEEEPDFDDKEPISKLASDRRKSSGIVEVGFKFVRVNTAAIF